MSAGGACLSFPQGRATSDRTAAGSTHLVPHWDLSTTACDSGRWSECRYAFGLCSSIRCDAFGPWCLHPSIGPSHAASVCPRAARAGCRELSRLSVRAPAIESRPNGDGKLQLRLKTDLQPTSNRTTVRNTCVAGRVVARDRLDLFVRHPSRHGLIGLRVGDYSCGRRRPDWLLHEALLAGVQVRPKRQRRPDALCSQRRRSMHLLHCTTTTTATTAPAATTAAHAADRHHLQYNRWRHF